MMYTSFQFKSRFEVLGNTKSPNKVWFVLHGYGQQAQYFIRKFRPLLDEETLIIAPEGLHRFYLKGSNGRVGASWMTKEDRDTDIENYLAYLNAIADSINLNNLEVNLIGFSQGAATASRWLNEGKITFSKFVLWASVFPPDLNFEIVPDQLKSTKTYFAYGKQDEYLDTNAVNKFKSKLDDLQIDVKYITFNGGHDIDEKSLLEL